MGVFMKFTVVVLCVFAVCADRAAAQQVVAGALPGPTLEAQDTSEDGFERLSLQLSTANPEEPGGRELDKETSSPPIWPEQALVVSASHEAPEGNRVAVAGAVSADAAFVELGFEGGRVERIATVAGEAYTGPHAGQIRFFLSEIQLAPDTDDDPTSIRMFDAAGALTGVARAATGRDLRTQVLRRRAGGALVRVVASSSTTLAPLPLAPEHVSSSLCLQLAVASTTDTPEVACQDSDYEMVLGGRRGCGRVPSTLAGFVPAAATRIEVRLGSGKAARFATRAAPFGRAGRIVTAILPRGEAIRDVVALDAGGKALTRDTARVPPPDTRCDAQDYRYDEWYAYGDFVPGPSSSEPGTEVAAALPDGSHRLLIRDGGDDICVRIDGGELNCFRPPVGIDGLDSFGADLERGLVAAIYPSRVDSVDVLFKDGSRERVPAVAGGYTGRYAGALKFVFAPIARGRVVEGAIAYDANGRELGTSGVGDEENYTPLATALRDGRARLRVASFTTLLNPTVVPCFGLEIGGQRSDCPDAVGRFDPSSVNVRVPCDQPRTYVFGVARHDVKRVEIVLAGGRRVAVRTARFPHARHRVYLAVLGAHETVRAVRFVGGKVNNGKHTITLPGRPAVEQCGYESSTDLY